MHLRFTIFDLRLRRTRPGFSFTEILFAVMILGIGFIMIAAIFPVALKQTAQTNEEATAASIARAAMSTISDVANNQWMQPTVEPPAPTFTPFPNPAPRAIGEVWSFNDPRAAVFTGANPPWMNLDPATGKPLYPNNALFSLPASQWARIGGNLILPADRRFAWVALYRRDGTWTQGPDQNSSFGLYVKGDPFAQVIIIGVQVRNRDSYDPARDLNRANGSTEPATLEACLTTANLLAPNPDNNLPAMIRFTDPNEADRVGEGAFVVISDDNVIAPYRGHYNGRIFRLGAFHPANGRTNPQPGYELAPGYDSFPDPDPGLPAPLTGLTNARVYVVGRGYQDPTNPGSPPRFSGGVQDISIYTTYVRVN